MPYFKGRRTLGLARGVKLALGLEAGLVRGEPPDPERKLEEQNQKLRKAQERIERQQRQLARLRRSPEKAEPAGEAGGPETPFGDGFHEPLRVVHVGSHDVSGGAARASYRLHAGLRRLGHESKMFVAHKKSDDPAVDLFRLPENQQRRAEIRERKASIEADFARYEVSRPEIYRVGDSFNDDRSPFGAAPVEQIPPCDVVNLHITAGFIDFRAFFENVPEHTPVVWTLHDMYAFTGGCHYDYGCGRHTESCGLCPQLGSVEEEDLSREIWTRKHEALSEVPTDRLHIVAPSSWLADEARRSSLFGRFPVSHVPYSLDPQSFVPVDRTTARAELGIPQDATVVLFMVDSLLTRRKGYAVLAEALNGLEDVAGLLLVSVGGNRPQIEEKFDHLHFDFVSDDGKVTALYNAADLFVLPSLEENLGQTVLEAMSCGTPVVGSDVGGIPDLARPGETGELAKPGDPESLRDAISKLLDDPEDLKRLSANCRRVAVEEFPLDLQAGRYADLYRSLLKIRAG